MRIVHQLRAWGTSSPRRRSPTHPSRPYRPDRTSAPTARGSSCKSPTYIRHPLLSVVPQVDTTLPAVLDAVRHNLIIYKLAHAPLDMCVLRFASSRGASIRRSQGTRHVATPPHARARLPEARSSSPATATAPAPPPPPPTTTTTATTTTTRHAYLHRLREGHRVSGAVVDRCCTPSPTPIVDLFQECCIYMCFYFYSINNYPASL